MRRFLLIACLLLLPACSGCAWSDVFFGLFGDSAYSGGGVTAAEKRDHFDRSVSASQDYNR
jgi:hypothetical protein